jgi:parallel beta-helix repeat protein
LASYDSGTENALIEDNVVDTTRPGGIELYSDDGSIVRHNTVRFYAEGPCAFTGQTCGKIELTRKLHDAVGVGTQVYDNVGEVDFGNGSTAARNDQNTDPSTVSYVGPLTSWAGFELASGSPGSNAASDGLDTGIRVP